MGSTVKTLKALLGSQKKSKSSIKQDPFKNAEILDAKDAKKIKFLGSGNFGDVELYSIKGTQEAVKFSKGVNYDEKELANIQTLNEAIKNSGKNPSFYHSKINIPRPVVIDEKYGLASEYAAHGDVKDFLLALALGKSVDNPKVSAAFEADPAGFLNVMATEMRVGLSAYHELNHIHLDVAARNFLVYDFKDDDFKYDEHQNIIGLKSATVKISDHGRAEAINNINEKVTLAEKSHPLRWSDNNLIKANEASTMSDVYSLKATLISTLSLALGIQTESQLLRFKEGDNNAECAWEKTTTTNKKALETFLNNAETEIKAIQKKDKGMLTDEQYRRRMVTASSCLELIESYREYITAMPETDASQTNFKPAQAMQEDNKVFINAARSLITKQLNGELQRSMEFTKQEIMQKTTTQTPEQTTSSTSETPYETTPARTPSKEPSKEETQQNETSSTSLRH